MNPSYRMFYILIGGELGTWLSDYYDGLTPPHDPLIPLLYPNDLRGEVNAWGGPHITITDANRMTAPETVARAAREICSRHARPRIWFKGLATYPTALVIDCDSEDLLGLRREILEATNHLIERTPISNDEWDAAKAQVQCHAGPHQAENNRVLDRTRKIYAAHGSPMLPTAIHFRLPFLAHLCRELDAATAGEDRAHKQKSLDYYLAHGQPPWYASRSGLHLTICSGLRFHPHDPRMREPLAHAYRTGLWNEVQKRAGPQPYRPSALAIMKENPTRTIHTTRYDGLINDFVPEVRPDFEVCERVPFRRPDCVALAP